MRFGVLGALEVERDGRLLDLGAPLQRALLVRLLLDAPRPVSVDRLVEDLWAGAAPARASASLQAYVSNLRRVLEPDRPPRAPSTVLVTRPPGYLLQVADDDVDVVRFRRLAAAAAAAEADGDHATAHDDAVAALALWRGPALLDVREEPFATATVTELEDLRLAVEEVRLGSLIGVGREAQAAAELEALVLEHPLRERLWELLVVALYRAGRPAAALARYRRVHRLLDDELGLEPGPRLRELEAAVLRHDERVLGPAPAAATPGTTSAVTSTVTSAVTSAARAAAADEVPTTPTLDVAGRPPLVGRESLLQQLTATLLAAPHAGPRWVVLTGEAGIGKTRLAEALRDRVTAAGWRVAVGRCHDDADTPPFWLWTQLLRDLADDAPGEVPAGLAADLRTGSGGPAGDAARFAVYDAVHRRVAEAASGRPVLLLLDDLHWADGDSLRALRFLAVHLEAPVGVVATVRDDERSDALDDVLVALERRGATGVAVPPLEETAVGTIAQALLGGDLDPAVVTDLHARSGGNPFFAAELARLAGTRTDASGLPAGVRDVVGRRLARLPHDVRDLLSVAAVVGADVDVAVLAGATGHDVPTTLDRLDPALATGVLTESTALRVRFTHALLRDALLADVTPTARRRVHARVASALRRRHGPTTPELAHHLVEAGPLGDPAAARDAAVAVGRQALTQWAVDDAAQWFGRALEVHAQVEAVEGADPRTRHALLLARADALFRAGQVAPARGELAAAVGAAMAVDDLDGVGEAAAALAATGGVWTWADLGEVPPAVIPLLLSVLDRLGDEDSAARARVLSTVATGLYYGEDQAVVDRLSAEAVAVARRLGDPHLLADVLLDRAFAIRVPERSWEVVELADEALALPGLTDLQVVVGHGRRYYGLMHAGDYPAALDAHRQALDAAERAHLLGPQLQLAPLGVGVAMIEGRLDDAEHLLTRERARLELGDLPRLDTGLLGVHALIDLLRGRLEQQVDVVRRLAQDIPLRPFHQMLALVCAASGDVAAARAAWETSRTAPGVPWLEVMSDALDVDLRLAFFGRERAPGDEELLEVLRSREGMIAAAGTSYPWVPVALPLAVHEHRLGLLDDAERHLRDLLDRSASWGTRTWTTLARWRLAHVLAERDPGSAEAAALRSAAVAAAEDIGMVLPSPVPTDEAAHGTAAGSS